MHINEQDINEFFKHNIQFEVNALIFEISKDKKIILKDSELLEI